MAKIAKMDKNWGKKQVFFYNHGRTRKVDTSIFHEARLKFSTSGYEWKQSKMQGGAMGFDYERDVLCKKRKTFLA